MDTTLQLIIEIALQQGIWAAFYTTGHPALPGGFLSAAGKTSTTGLVQSITLTGGNFTYTYDDNGNITSVVQDDVETVYTYDALGQLTQVDDSQENATWKYEYDQGGNIKLKSKFGLNSTSSNADEIVEFKYDNANWRDQLTSTITKVKQANGTYSSTTATIEYDKIGNPTDDGTWHYEWVNGRQLARMHSVDTDASFVYNENGLRVRKTVNGVVTDYTLHGKNVVHMTRGNDELHFFYDTQNKPAIVVYNGVPYSYVKNLQGDIVAILDSNKNVVVSYVYDAWGKPISKIGTLASTLGTVQPFRYRGYVYDEETGLHYLRSRYYQSDLCRFCNADALLTHNLFAYCNCNPVLSIDRDGFCSQFTYTAYGDDPSTKSKLFSDYTGDPDAGPYLKYNRKPNVDMQQIELSYLLAALNEMIIAGADEKTRWNYYKGSMNWRKVDCAGMVRIIVQQVSQPLCLTLPTTVNGMRTLCGIEDENMQRIVEGINLNVGCAVFTYDPEHRNSQGKLVPWHHMGVYVGTYVHPLTGEIIYDAVIQSSSEWGYVDVKTLSKTGFTHYADMPFINYPDR